MIRGLLLILWGWIVVWSVISGRVDLLMHSVFHSLVAVSGIALLGAGVLITTRNQSKRERLTWPWITSSTIAVAVLLIPPNPSFSDLAGNRPQSLPEPPDLAFVLPPEQRTLTEWVRYLSSQADPDLVEGNPVNISGFVWEQANAPPLLARLTVRCCLADATPAGLPVSWPEGNTPKANQWLAINGTMAVELQHGERIAIVKPKRIQQIDRPERPLEP